jgi:hypothetical protein
MLEPRLKFFSACVAVFDPEQAKKSIQQARQNEKVRSESPTRIQIEMGPTGLETYFLSLKDCQEHLIDLEFQGWKKH